MVRKVLFVDDDQILKLVVEKRLERLADHFEVVMAGDGFEALKLLERVPVSLICLDLKMPRMDGQSLLQHLTEYYPDIPVLIISSMEPELVRPLLALDVVVGFFQKPFNIEDLGEKIMELLKKEAQAGIMLNVSPVMFMQLMEMEKKSCTIRMLDNVSGAGAVLYLLHGQLLDVRIGKKTGMDAAYDIFSWDEVTVFFRNECQPRENVINCELQSIIMGALAAKDEQNLSEFGESEGSPVVGPIAGDDLGLPSDGIDEDEGNSVVVPHLSLEVDDDQLSSESEEACEFLRDELGNPDGIVATRRDDAMTEVLTRFSELGELAGMGPLKVCYLENDKQGTLFVPGEPLVALELNENFPVEQALKSIQKRK